MRKIFRETILFALFAFPSLGQTIAPALVSGAPGLIRTDHSGTITLGGTAQSLMSANTSRHGCSLQNLSTGDLWVNEIGGTAAATQPSTWVPAGSYWSCAFNATPSAISIFGATTSQAFNAREW